MSAPTSGSSGSGIPAPSPTPAPTVPAAPTVATVCTPTILARFADDTSFDAWKGSVDTSLNTISSTTAAGTVPATAAQETSLLSAMNNIMSTTACIQEKLSTLSGTTNQISKGQESKIAIQKEIDDAEADVAIARDRVEYIKHPEQHTSNYESWFPLNRPMRESSAPYLISITAIFAVTGFFIFMSLIGVNINITTDTAFVEVVRLVSEQVTYTTIILLIILSLSFRYIIQSRNNSGGASNSNSNSKSNSIFTMGGAFGGGISTGGITAGVSINHAMWGVLVGVIILVAVSR